MTPPTRVELEIIQSAEVWGKIVLELDEQKAPQTVKNFLRYVDAKFYDGTIFHRVIESFMVQGGGMTAPGKDKRSELFDPIENEGANGLSNLRGTVAMARTSDPHSATSQFFINVVDNKFLDHPGHDGWGYCVFARVVEGMDVVDRIRKAPTKRDRGEDSMPVDPPLIKSARRLK